MRKADNEPRRQILVDDDKPLRWQQRGWVRFIGWIMFVGVGAAMWAFCTVWWDGSAKSLVLICLAPLTMWALVDECTNRVDLTPTSVIVRKTFRTRAYALSDVASARSERSGLLLGFADGTTASVSVKGTAPRDRWFGRISKGDIAAATVMRRAALARGESPDPVEIVARRGPDGVLEVVITVALAVTLGG